MLPGLIDSHVHAPSASMYEFDQPVPDMESIEDVLAFCPCSRREDRAGRWITLSQVFITRLREQRYPTRAELDRAAPRHPVAFRTGPDASLNSMALSMSGIDAKFQVPTVSPAASSATASGQPDGHPAQLRPLHPIGAGRRPSRRPPIASPAAGAAGRLQLGRHHQHRRRATRIRTVSSCTARSSHSTR